MIKDPTSTSTSDSSEWNHLMEQRSQHCSSRPALDGYWLVWAQTLQHSWHDPFVSNLRWNDYLQFFATPLILNCATFGAFCPIIGHYCISPDVAPLKRLGLCDIFRTLTCFFQESSGVVACICTSLHFSSPCSYSFSHILLYIFCLSKLLMNKWVLAQLVKASVLKK